MFNRRTFLKNGAAALPLATALNGLDPASATSGNDVAAIVSDPAPKLIPLPPRRASLDLATQPWQKKVRRVGQSNMTEHDPAVMDIEEWANYWHSAGADVVFISVTGILAFYPSKVKFHRHGKFLNGRDFFGECVAAAKKRVPAILGYGQLHHRRKQLEAADFLAVGDVPDARGLVPGGG